MNYEVLRIFTDGIAKSVRFKNSNVKYQQYYNYS
jgi:hypothetical protein